MTILKQRDWFIKLTAAGVKKYNEYWHARYPGEPHWVPAKEGHEVYLTPDARQDIFGEKG
jgi:hypothetical protein